MLQGQREYNFSHLGMEEGFTNSRANAIIQDQKGFMWVGTWNGLNRYDGYNCVTYLPNFHDSTSISNREIVALLEDSKGRIWIGTTNGLSCLTPETGKIKNYEFSNRILSLFEDKNSCIWIGTWGGGLYSLVPSNGKIRHYLGNDIVSDIYIDSRNIFWVASFYGFMKFDRETGNSIRFLPQKDKNSISHSAVTQIAETTNGKLWVGTWGGGLNKVDVFQNGDSLHFSHYNNIEVVSVLYHDQYRNLWIGSRNKGLFLLKEAQQKRPLSSARFVHYKHKAGNSSGISNQRISALHVDRSGVLWVGGGTIDKTSIIENGINRYSIPMEDKNPRKKVVIKSFAEYKNQLWIASENTILQYELKNGTYSFRKKYTHTSFQIGASFFSANSIFDLKADTNGLWVGTEDAGLIHYSYTKNFLLNSKNRKIFTQYTHPAISGNKVCCISISKKYPGVIWIGTQQSGFSKIVQHKNNTFETEKYYSGNSEKNSTDNNIRSIYEDSFGRVWIGTQNGLNCFNPDNKTFKHFFYSSFNKSSINDNVINTIQEDHSGNLWIGTNSGLNKKTEVLREGKTSIQFKGYPQTDFLNNGIVNNLLEDRSGYLWIRMYRGFVKFNEKKETVDCEYFSKDFENISFERNSSLKLNNGNFVIGNQAGFLTFNPDSMLKESTPPKVVITDLQIFNKSITSFPPTQKGKEKNKTVSYKNHLTLSYKEKMLTFVFSAMDFKDPQKNSYAYMLEGFDKQWNSINSHNSATYTNIPNGKYTFKVKARNSDGFESKFPTELQITILPPWWKTTWAYIAYSLIVIGLLYFFQKYTIIRAKEKSTLEFERLKAREQKRLSEQKSLFFTDITHELRTPLTLILAPSEELSQNKKLDDNTQKMARLINNSAHKLLRLVNQLMEFRKIEKGIPEQLILEPCNINQLLNEIFRFFNPMADSKKINFRLELPTPPIEAFVHPEKFEKIIFNLLSNAFKYTNEEGKITMSAELAKGKNTDNIIVSVQDTGIGISRRHQEKIFERFYQANQVRTQSTGGIGLFMAKALAEQHSGTILLESEEGKGSSFRLILPYKQAREGQNEVKITKKQDTYTALQDSTGTIPFENVLSEKKKSIHKLTVLIVEDDVDLINFLVNGLSGEFKIISAHNGIDALDKAKKEFPDLILTDIMMPKMDGFEFCAAIRKDLELSHIPVIFLTAKTMKEDQMKGLKLGAVDYILKPFNLHALKLKISNQLSLQKQIREKLRTQQILQPEHIELASLDEKFLKDAVDSVNHNLDNPAFDVEAFSSELKVSPNQVYRKIKALTGQTAKEFIRNQRLKVAADLLIQQKRSISEVIYMVGFTSPSYFSRCFKNFYGCTPKEYIEQNA